MSDAAQPRPKTSVRRWACALLCPATLLACPNSSSESSSLLNLDRSAGRDAEFTRVLAYFERVPAAPVGAKSSERSGRASDLIADEFAGPAVGPAAPAAEESVVESAVALPLPEPKRRVQPATPAAPAPKRGAAEFAATPPTPELKPRADRSDEVLALLKHAVATSPTASTSQTNQSMHPTPSARYVKPVLKPQVPFEQRVVTDATPSRSVSAQAPAGGSDVDDSIEALRRELRLRDAVIAELLQRVEQLEQRMVLNDSQLDRAVGGAGPPSLLRRSFAEDTTPPAPSTPAAPTPEPAADDAEAQDPVQTAQAENVQAGDQGASAPPAAPGQFTVDEAEAARALERTLVQEGVLLLALGEAEVDPSFTYTRRENSFPVVVGGNVVAQQKVRRNEFDSDTSLRVGLPWDSQLEVDVPYSYVDQSNTTEVGGSTVGHSDRSGSGLGDIEVGFAKTLVQENGGWWPDVVARVNWDAPTGSTRSNGVFLGGGFNEVSGSLNLVKRQDPLAFVGGVAYSKSFENDNIEPGDELGFSIGTVLAASPETSLSFIFNQAFANETKVDGETIDGSDAVSGTFRIGASTILGRNTLLSVTGDIGLTDDAPDYAIGVSLPVRFNVPPN
jgi:Putative MetA-pathway of phenol degradation